MKKNEVQIGHVYAVKVSGCVVPVKIESEAGTRRVYKGTCYGIEVPTAVYKEKHNGWKGVNLKTNRAIHIHTAAKLRYELFKCGDCGRWTQNGSKQCKGCIAREAVAEQMNPAKE